ncbi:hypothetical protein Q4Q39_11055 [Flavivirga amylovorans]|uniref:PrsW family intramembrane metalloprotease n=1 Tax=Flavivirga amylovorans TaxID=870486 RepID=A0ABT8X1W0_9FLAO|nr:hypothetical protein [Flavivirga amylovorans]MDO5987941.1 hypothetical protein [Flavivirga amylovorans]
MLKLFSSSYNVSKRVMLIIFITPIILTIIMGLLFVFPSTEKLGFWLLEENSPIELLTFIIFLYTGILGIYTIKNFNRPLEKYAKVFYLFFSICLILIAMEEISWGQWFFHFDTPEEWAKINGQGETTLHNLQGMQGHSGILRILFGLGGMFGIILGSFNKFKTISVPYILVSWFFIIFCHAVVDSIQDRVSISVKYDFAIVKTSEFIELLIAGSSFLYFWLNFKMLKDKK